MNELIKQFVDTFMIFDDGIITIAPAKKGFVKLMGKIFQSNYPSIPKEMWVSDLINENGTIQWKIIQEQVAPDEINKLESRLKCKLPNLYVELISNYRFWEVYLKEYRLLANPTGNGFEGLIGEIFKDEQMCLFLSNNNLIQFGKDESHYDPVCFDLLHKVDDIDYKIVKVDHEAILQNGKIEKKVIADSFKALINKTIANAMQ